MVAEKDNQQEMDTTENKQDKKFKEEKDEYPPRSIIIGNYTYTYKDTNKSGFSYRCKFKSLCNFTMTIDSENLDIIIKQESKPIKFKKTSIKYPNHTCKIKENSKSNLDNNTLDNNIITENISYTKKELYKTASILIKQNLHLKPLWHKNNLKNNNIDLSLNKIRNILYSLREEKFPDELYILNDISKITINLGNEENRKNLPFCPMKLNFINYNQNNRQESFIIFGTVWQLKLFFKVTYIFVDATFKTSPRGFYQTLNIMGFVEEIQMPIPLLIIPMTHKSFESYNNIFIIIKNLLENLNMKINFDKYIFITDYEKALRNGIIRNFPKSRFEGCYFHYVKILWCYAKKNGLCTKNRFKYTRLLIFCLKIYPYLVDEEQNNFLKEIKEYFNKIDDKYSEFFLYFDKNWKNNNLLRFQYFSEEKYLFRTNNFLERYHLLLSEIIENFHPKLPYYLDKIKNIIQSYYTDYIDNITKINKKEIYQFDIRKDIVNFIVNFQKRYKKKINFIGLVQMNIEDLVGVSKIVYNFLDIVFGIENSNETEDLIVKNFEDLSKEEQYNYFTKIKFIKNNVCKNLESIEVDNESEKSEEESESSEDIMNQEKSVYSKEGNSNLEI